MLQAWRMTSLWWHVQRALASHTRLDLRFASLKKTLQWFSMRSFVLGSNRILKMEPVPNWNRFLGFGILKWPSLPRSTGISSSSQIFIFGYRLLTAANWLSRFLVCEKFYKIYFLWCHKITKWRVANDKESNGLNHFRKVCFDVWNLKLEILTCFDAVQSYVIFTALHSKP